MSRPTSLIGAAGLGAGLMYLFDPERGRRRRALIHDKVVHLTHQVEDAVDVTVTDLGHRVRGLFAEVRGAFAPDRADDQVLVERVRSSIGRVVRHPGAILVDVEGGRVTLRGPVLADEVDRLIGRVQAVRGVREVTSSLEVHQEPGDVPGLQGHPEPSDERPEPLQAYWSPTMRLIGGLIGSGLAVYGASHRGLAGAVAGGVGLGLLARAVTNLESHRLIGIGAGRRAVDVQKTITVRAPVEQVFDFWSHPENFSRFMAHVVDVRKVAPDRYLWTVSGPVGLPVSWEATIAKSIPNRVLAWKTVPGSAVAHAGIVHFDRMPDGSTRLDIKLSYNPPAGAVGHFVASLFGSDPKHALDDDLVRLKSLVEVGKTTAHGEEVSREEVAPDVGGARGR